MTSIEITKQENLLHNIVEIKNDVAFADSLQIAKHFNKEHTKVTRSIEKILNVRPELSPKVATSFFYDNNRKYKMYKLDRDMFSLIVMGFTGKKALDWKLFYIEAFNKMEAIINEKKSTDWQLIRKNGKLTRRNETDVISAFIEYAQNQGSSHGTHYYKHYTDMVHKAVGIRSGERDHLTPAMMAHVATFEDQVSSLALHLMQKGVYYKDIYQEVKAKISLISSVMMMPENKYLPTTAKQQRIES